MTEHDPLTYDQLYRNLDGVTALLTAESTPLKKLPDERDTAFVKRIVATFMAFEARRFWIKRTLGEGEKNNG